MINYHTVARLIKILKGYPQDALVEIQMNYKNGSSMGPLQQVAECPENIKVVLVAYNPASLDFKND